MISRAHRFDLYLDQQPQLYFPFRTQVLPMINELHLISENGLMYMLNAYPEYSEKYKVSRLGVRNPGFLTKKSLDGRFRLVSCSHIVDVKRLDLLVSALNVLGNSNPNQEFQWDHFGDGPLFSKIESLSTKLPANVKPILWGKLPNKEILNKYKNNPVDVFLNVSKSEGVPVSIMEALSCGIPVIATSVGGVPEIIDANNGVLLRSDPSPIEISDAIWALLSNPDDMDKKRKTSISMWQNHFNADINYQHFSKELFQLLLRQKTIE